MISQDCQSGSIGQSGPGGVGSPIPVTGVSKGMAGGADFG